MILAAATIQNEGLPMANKSICQPYDDQMIQIGYPFLACTRCHRIRRSRPNVDPHQPGVSCLPQRQHRSLSPRCVLAIILHGPPHSSVGATRECVQLVFAFVPLHIRLSTVQGSSEYSLSSIVFSVSLALIFNQPSIFELSNLAKLPDLHMF